MYTCTSRWQQGPPPPQCLRIALPGRPRMAQPVHVPAVSLRELTGTTAPMLSTSQSWCRGRSLVVQVVEVSQVHSRDTTVCRSWRKHWDSRNPDFFVALRPLRVWALHLSAGSTLVGGCGGSRGQSASARRIRTSPCSTRHPSWSLLLLL